MSHAIAHRPHVHDHVSLLPVLAVIVTVLVAALAIWALNRPETFTTTSTQAVTAPAIAPAAVAAPESPVFRHQLMRIGGASGLGREYVVNLHHLVGGTTLDPVSSTSYTATYVSPNYARAARAR